MVYVVFSLDRVVIKVYPDGTRALKKRSRSVGSSCGAWTTKLHLTAASAECAVIFYLSPGQVRDAPELWAMIRDRAYEGDETRKLVSELDFSPAVPPKSSQTEPWEYDKELYKTMKSNECSGT